MANGETPAGVRSLESQKMTEHHPSSKPVGHVPGEIIEDVPKEDLKQQAREMTEMLRRITDEDRQRVASDLKESGHQQTIQSSAPYLLQGFFSGRLDLDVELTRRYPAPPLLSSMTFAPKPGQTRRHGFAQFTSQDTSSMMTVEIHGSGDTLEIGFLMYSMIGVRFTLESIGERNRQRFAESLDRAIERDNGIAFLWTRERWERDYVIFVLRNGFGKMYAFGPGRVEAACRLTPDGVTQFRTWLGGFWKDSAPPPSEPPPAAPSQPSQPPDTTFTW
jgi:hypothetical protein